MAVPEAAQPRFADDGGEDGERAGECGGGIGDEHLDLHFALDELDGGSVCVE